MWLGKRVFDFCISLASLVILFPCFILIAVWIKVDSKGPVFFRQKRVGLGEKGFYIHKFRTMYLDDSSLNSLQITLKGDDRITRAGRVLRRFKIDELPQLIDVLIGKMSIVGPRPEVPYYVNFYESQMRNQIFQIKPGITDWASVKFKNENALLENCSDPEHKYVHEILPIKLTLSSTYFSKASLFEDLKIIFATVLAIVK